MAAPLRVLLVGLGHMGMTHGRAYHALEGYELAGLCARSIANRARAAVEELFKEVDVLLTFSAPGAAPKGLDSTGDARFNQLWTLMGVPCVNVPTLVAEGGLPVGVTVIAKFGADAQALAAASFVEDALKA